MEEIGVVHVLDEAGDPYLERVYNALTSDFLHVSLLQHEDQTDLDTEWRVADELQGLRELHQKTRYNLLVVCSSESYSELGVDRTEIKMEDAAQGFDLTYNMNYADHSQNSRGVDIVLHRTLRERRCAQESSGVR